MRDSPGETPDRLHLLRLEETLLALPERRFGPLALGQVHQKSDAVWVVEHCHAEEDGYASAVLADELLLPLRSNPLFPQSCDRELLGRSPLRRSRVRPPSRTCTQILARVANRFQVGVVCVVYLSEDIGDADTDDS